MLEYWYCGVIPILLPLEGLSPLIVILVPFLHPQYHSHNIPIPHLVQVFSN